MTPNEPLPITSSGSYKCKNEAIKWLVSPSSEKLVALVVDEFVDPTNSKFPSVPVINNFSVKSRDRSFRICFVSYLLCVFFAMYVNLSERDSSPSDLWKEFHFVLVILDLIQVDRSYLF